MKQMTWTEFSTLYCERQEQTPAGLRNVLAAQIVRFQPTGWMLLEAHDMSSSWLGSLVILPYGPNNTYKEPPTHPISPRGLASDMSVVIGLLPAEELPKVQR